MPRQADWMALMAHHMGMGEETLGDPISHPGAEEVLVPIQQGDEEGHHLAGEGEGEEVAIFLAETLREVEDAVHNRPLAAEAVATSLTVTATTIMIGEEIVDDLTTMMMIGEEIGRAHV